MSRFENEVAAAVQRGLLERPGKHPCAACGAQAIEYHHPSYADGQALVVTPLCTSCHMRVHSAQILDPSNGLRWCRVCEASVDCEHPRGISHPDARRVRAGGTARGPRTKDIRIPVTDEEHAEIHRRAATAGRPTADWTRRVLLGFETAPPSTEEQPAPDGRVRKSRTHGVDVTPEEKFEAELRELDRADAPRRARERHDELSHNERIANGETPEDLFDEGILNIETDKS